MSFRGVTKTFGAVRAVAGADLSVARGETVALLGRSGAGKSTMIGLLLGVERPDMGTVRLFGGAPGRAVAEGRVGVMLQEGGPIRRATVREVLTIALAGGPELLVLDEPAAALEREARSSFWSSLRGYAGRGNAVLFSTRSLEEADRYADRIVVIDHGRIVADGTSERIKEAVGGHAVSFDLSDGLDEPTIARLPGVVSMSVRGRRVRLRSDDSDATVIALAARGAVHRLEVRPATLEDAFLALTTDPLPGRIRPLGPLDDPPGRG
ncbi:ABC transporter ATP-binding protein [Streptomyces sp. NPDC093085]|uniref:ABC transporter ATP-binding protein n=1 Tax=Streptomyces sp. NPDC093085 TaxID=3155068 RepID=UPI0034189986